MNEPEIEKIEIDRRKREIKAIKIGLGSQREPASNPTNTWSRTSCNGDDEPRSIPLTQPTHGGGTRRVPYGVCDHQPWQS